MLIFYGRDGGEFPINIAKGGRGVNTASLPISIISRLFKGWSVMLDVTPRLSESRGCPRYKALRVTL